MVDVTGRLLAVDLMMENRKLRLITYLSPGLPIQLYQVYQRYLEEALKCDSYLMIESRWSGPPHDRVNPFTDDDVDIGFVCSTSYLEEVEINNNKFVELLPVAPIHVQEKSQLRPIYFSDIIVRKEKAKTYKTFHDLKGHRWAVNEEASLSGNCAVLAELKKMGFNSTFFGDIQHSGSHHNSIAMVTKGTVDAAAVDSNVLKHWLEAHPGDKEELHVLTSLGPLPIQPIVINSRLPGEVKTAITTALLAMNKSSQWQSELSRYHVWGFKPIDHTLYNKEKEIMDVIKDQKLHTIYY